LNVPVLIRIPTPLRGFTNGQATVEAEGTTVSGVLLDLVAKYPAIRDKLYDSEGLRMFIKIYRSSDNRFLANPETSVKDGDQLSILPAVAGGISLGP
jgi:molybdopterin converting factor small subunit